MAKNKKLLAWKELANFSDFFWGYRWDFAAFALAAVSFKNAASSAFETGEKGLGHKL